MTVTVIGHLCLDVIHHADGAETQSYGGIFFSLSTLANLLPSSAKILPVFGVGKDDYPALISRLEAYSNIDPSGIYKFSGPTNSVHLFYKDGNKRVECSRNIAEPISFRRIRSSLDSDIVLVNMISGLDITLETLDEIRMEVRDNHTPVYFDAHSLTLGIKEDFTRFHRPVELWRRWLFMVHAVQMNEDEAAIISGMYADENELAKQILALNTRTVIVTRGEKGCTAFIDEHKHLQRVDVPGESTGRVVDPTGCGDVFGAAYCAQYLVSRRTADAVGFANHVASRKAAMAGSSTIDQLSDFRLPSSQQEQKVSS